MKASMYAEIKPIAKRVVLSKKYYSGVRNTARNNDSLDHTLSNVKGNSQRTNLSSLSKSVERKPYTSVRFYLSRTF